MSEKWKIEEADLRGLYLNIGDGGKIFFNVAYTVEIGRIARRHNREMGALKRRATKLQDVITRLIDENLTND